MSDAIILLEGDGFDRFRKAVSLYKQGKAPKIVFSGNITDYDYGSYPFEEVLPRMLEAGVPEDDIIHEDKSLNTREQAVEVVRMAQERGWKKLILVASHEHQYRAYLTFLREVLDSKSGITLYNAPAAASRCIMRRRETSTGLWTKGGAPASNGSRRRS